MTIQIRKAERKKAKLRLGIASTSGGGKTYSSLLLAFGLGGKVGMIDTENGSGDLYAHLGSYDIITISAPYTVAKYREAIKAFEDAGYTTIIIDSLSHAWAGEGGLLDKQGKVAEIVKNSYTAWRAVTPDHNALVESMLQSPCHIIATMRSKTDYVLEDNEHGKKTPRKVGLAPIQREGMEYEFTIMLDLSIDHTAHTTKDRTGLFDGQFFKVTPDVGRNLAKWLETGADVKLPAPVPTPQPAAQTAPATAQEQNRITGKLAEVKTRNTPKGTCYGIKLSGDARFFYTYAAPAAERAKANIGATVVLAYATHAANGKTTHEALGFEVTANAAA